MTPLNNCINLSHDTRGFYYEIPNFCINDPSIIELAAKIEKKRPREKIVEFIVRKVIEEKKYKMKNSELILELKNKVAKDFYDYELEKDKIRFFFRGKELNDHEELWFHNIDDGSIILMMIKSLS